MIEYRHGLGPIDKTIDHSQKLILVTYQETTSLGHRQYRCKVRQRVNQWEGVRAALETIDSSLDLDHTLYMI